MIIAGGCPLRPGCHSGRRTHPGMAGPRGQYGRILKECGKTVRGAIACRMLAGEEAALSLLEMTQRQFLMSGGTLPFWFRRPEERLNNAYDNHIVSIMSFLSSAGYHFSPDDRISGPGAIPEAGSLRPILQSSNYRCGETVLFSIMESSPVYQLLIYNPYQTEPECIVMFARIMTPTVGRPAVAGNYSPTAAARDPVR